MAKKKAVVAGAPGLDPTLPDAEVTVDGKTYHLVYDFDAIARAERALNAAAAAATPKDVPFVPINLLRGFDLENAGAEQLRGMFYAALLSSQPKITLAEVSRLIRMDTLKDIYDGLTFAWMKSFPPKVPAKAGEVPRPTEDQSPS